MLGLGTNIIKSGAGVKTIVTDNLVLKHNYALSPVQPLSDGAAFFDPTDDYIDFGNACNLGAADFSIAFWVYTDNLSTNYFLSKREDDNDRWYIRSDAQEKFHMFCKIGGSVIFSVTSSTAWTSLENTWIHVAFTADRGGNHKIYVNGVLDVTDSESSTTDVDNTGDLYMNRFSGSYGTAGSGTGNYICNTGIWNAALSQPQIKSIMNKNYAGLSASEKTDLVSWWNLSADANDNHGSNNGTLS